MIFFCADLGLCLVHLKGGCVLEVQEVEKIARLARIHLTPDEKARFAEEFNNILNYFNQLKAANTDNMEPLLNPHATDFFSRQDEVQPFAGAPDVLLANAPSVQGRLYKTPPVV